MALDSTKQLGKLREFSRQLAERIKAAPLRATEPMRLAVRIGAASYLLPMAAAGEIVAATDIAPVPWTKPWYRGLTNVRGRLIGVIDLLQFSGRGALPVDQSTQLLVFGESLAVNAGVLITRAFGLRNLNELEPLGPAGDDAASWETVRYRDLDGTVLTELDLGVLIATDAFAAIAA